MVVVPALTAFTIPPVPIVATPVVLLLQTPSAVALASVVFALAHTLSVPVIAATVGIALTVTTELTVVVQLKPFVTTYEIVEVPAAIPVTIPEVPIVATEVLLLDHTPPDVVFDKEVVDDSQTVKAPAIAGTVGKGLTVTTAVTKVEQPEAFSTVYVITDVPADTPLTIPEVPTVATPVLPLLHVPLAVVLDSVVVDPAQTLKVPVMGATGDIAVIFRLSTVIFGLLPELPPDPL
jgi:hypothetical protein